MKIGPYHVEEELGRGGMAVVYRGRHEGTGARVALKLVVDAGALGSPRRRRFEREAEALRRLDHPGLVRVLEVGEHQGRPYMALEFVVGGTLEERLRREGPLSNEGVVELGLALAGALGVAHARGVLHRDLKPDNVLFDGVGRPKVADFGLVRALDGGQSRLTHSGSWLGTPGYMPPEQMRGELEALGPACDVYGLGGVLYAAATGQPPIQGESLPQVLLRTEEEAPRSLRELRAEVDPRLEQVVLRCLEKDPVDRYASMAELGDALQGCLKARESARVGWVGLGALLAVGVGVGAAWVQSVGAEVGPEEGAEVGPVEPVDDGGVGARAELLERGRQHEVDGAWDAAERCYSLVLEDAPEEGAAWAARGVLRWRRGRGEEARWDLERALACGVSDAEVAVVLAEVCLESGEALRAVEVCGAVLDEDAGHAEARAVRGRAYLVLGSHARASEDLEVALAQRPDEAVWWTYHGGCRNALGDAAGALVSYRRAAEAAPERADVQYNLAYQLQRMGQATEALRAYERVLALEPGDADALNNAAQVLVGVGREAEGLRLFGAALEADPRDVVARINRGVVHLNAGRCAEALADFEAGLEVEPGHFHLRCHRAELWLQLGLFVWAQRDLEALTAEEREEAWARTLRGRALLLSGRVREAVEVFRGVLREASQEWRPVSWLAVGCVYLGANAEARRSFAWLERAVGGEAVRASLELLEGAREGEPVAWGLSPSEREALEEGLEADDPSQGVRAIRSALAWYPLDPRVWQGLGRVLRRLGWLPEAAFVLERGMALAQDDLEVLRWLHLNLGEVCGELGRGEESRRWFEAALAREEEDAEAWAGLGSAWRQVGRLDESVTALTRSLELRPGAPSVLSERAEVYARLGQLEAAIADLTQALEGQEGAAERAASLMERGVVKCRLRRWEEGVQDFSVALALRPGVALTWAHRGEAYRALERWEEALSDWTRAIALEPEQARHYAGRARLLWSLGERARALRDLDQAVALAPEEPAFWKARADARCALGRLEEGAGDLARFTELVPGDVEGWRQRAQLCVGLGRWREAEAHFDAALALEPRDLGTRCDRGVTRLLAGDTAGAEAALAGVTDLAPESPEARLLGALVCLERGEYAAAVSTLEGWGSESAVVRAYRGVARAARGEVEAGRAEWEAALAELAPGHPAARAVEELAERHVGR